MSSHIRVCTTDTTDATDAQAMVARNEVALHDCFNLSWGEEEEGEEEGGGVRGPTRRYI